MNKILNLEETYISSNYFELKLEAQDLPEEFGYALERKNLNSPKYLGEIEVTLCPTA